MKKCVLILELYPLPIGCRAALVLKHNVQAIYFNKITHFMPVILKLYLLFMCIRKVRLAIEITHA